MSKFYTSKYYSRPIEVINNNWEIVVVITDEFDRKSIYSWYNLDEKNSNSPYVNKCLLWGFMQESIKNILVIWAWWWAFIKYLEDHIDPINITWIDIDKTMIEIAEVELKIKKNNIIFWDILSSLDELIIQNNKYDLILFDIYWSNWEIPDNIINTNIFNNIKILLNDKWVFSINYSNFNIHSNSNVDKSRVGYYKSIHKELKKNFPKDFIAFSSWYKQWENISWIYNLAKKYSLNEIKNNYFKKILNNEIIYDSKIIESIYLDNEWLFLN